MRPEHLSVIVGAGLGEAFALGLDGDSLLFEHSDQHFPPASFEAHPKASDWRRFRRILDELDVWSWRSEYAARRPPTDGVGWEVEISYDDRRIASEGYEAYPQSAAPEAPDVALEPDAEDMSPDFARLCRAVSALLGGREFGWQRARRRAPSGLAKGSQRRIREWVNERPRTLDSALFDASTSLRAVATDGLCWLAPLQDAGYREVRDELWRVADLPSPTPQQDRFWPRRGPVWDAVAAAPGARGPGVVLVEAKSHEAELRGSGSVAGESSLYLINNSLSETKSYLGVPEEADWTGRYYQLANRLAFLYYLRVRRGIPAWLAFAYFLGDAFESGDGRVVGPATQQVWEAELREAKGELELPSHHALSDFCIDVFLPASISDVDEWDRPQDRPEEHPAAAAERVVEAFLDRRPDESGALGGCWSRPTNRRADYMLIARGFVCATLRSADVGGTIVNVPEGLQDHHARAIREMVWGGAERRGHWVVMDNDALKRVKPPSDLAEAIAAGRPGY